MTDLDLQIVIWQKKLPNNLTPVKDLKKSLQQVFFHCAGDGPSQLLESDDPRDGECGEALISASK